MCRDLSSRSCALHAAYILHLSIFNSTQTHTLLVIFLLSSLLHDLGRHTRARGARTRPARVLSRDGGQHLPVHRQPLFIFQHVFSSQHGARQQLRPSCKLQERPSRPRPTSEGALRPAIPARTVVDVLAPQRLAALASLAQPASHRSHRIDRAGRPLRGLRLAGPLATYRVGAGRASGQTDQDHALRCRLCGHAALGPRAAGASRPLPRTAVPR